MNDTLIDALDSDFKGLHDKYIVTPDVVGDMSDTRLRESLTVALRTLLIVRATPNNLPDKVNTDISNAIEVLG